MKFFNVIKANKFISELEAQIESLTSKMVALDTELTTLKENTKSQVELVAAHEDVLKQIKDTHATELTALKAEYENKISALEKSKDQVALTTANKAADIVASLGVEPEAVKANVSDVNIQKHKGYKVTHYR